MSVGGGASRWCGNGDLIRWCGAGDLMVNKETGGVSRWWRRWSVVPEKKEMGGGVGGWKTGQKRGLRIVYVFFFGSFVCEWIAHEG